MPEIDPADTEISGIFGAIRDYYTAKIRRYGPNPLGVDWRCVPTQQLRFVQLLKLCDGAARFSLDDLGCGYGALLSYLAERHAAAEINYLGVDLSPAMIRYARRLWPGRSFVVGHASPRMADYCIASGIFNVKQDQPLEHWERFVGETLDRMADNVRRGFAVNLMGPVTETKARAAQLYRSSAGRWIRYCEEELGMAVTLLDGYGMREYTLLAFKR
jgi:hypothetical protein